MSNYVGCSQYSILCYVVFLKTVVSLYSYWELLPCWWISLLKRYQLWISVSYFFFFHFNLQNRHSVWMLLLFLRGLETKHSLCLKKYFHKTVLLCDTFKTGWKNWLKLLYVFRHVILEQPAFFGQQVTWIAKKASW